MRMVTFPTIRSFSPLVAVSSSSEPAGVSRYSEQTLTPIADVVSRMISSSSSSGRCVEAAACARRTRKFSSRAARLESPPGTSSRANDTSHAPPNSVTHTARVRSCCSQRGRYASRERLRDTQQQTWREHFAGVELPVPVLGGGMVTGINFDNAASTPPLERVRDAVTAFSDLYSSVHRGTGYKSRLATEAYEQARELVAKFLGVDDRAQVVIF